MDNLLVGWRFGAPALGFYKKAYDLFSLSASQLVSSISVVAVSALSRARNDTAQFRHYLLGAMAVMTFIGMWIAGDFTLIGKDLIRVLLGPGWEEAGSIFVWFAPGIGAMMLYGTHGWIHLSIGRADRWLRWGLIEWIVTILLFVAAIHWGPRGIAAAWCASFWVLTLPAIWFAGKPNRTWSPTSCRRGMALRCRFLDCRRGHIHSDANILPARCRRKVSRKRSCASHLCPSRFRFSTSPRLSRSMAA